MNYPLNLTRAFFATITILLTVQISGGTDCTPTGTHLNDTVTGQCSLDHMETTRVLRFDLRRLTLRFSGSPTQLRIKVTDGESAASACRIAREARI